MKPSNLIILFILALLLSSCSYLPKIESVRPKQKLFNISWVKNLDIEHESGNPPIGLGSPLVIYDIVYMGSLEGYMRAYDLKSGAIIWEKKDKGALGTKPVYYKNKILYGSYDGRLYSRNALKGNLEYVIDLGSSIETEPIVYRDRLYVHLRNHKLVCLDAVTGKVLWAYQRSIPFATTLQRNSVPLAYKNKIIVGFADSFLVAFGAEDGMLLWERKISTGTKFVDVDARPTLFKGKIYVGAASSPLAIVNPDTGMVIKTIDIAVAREVHVLGNNLLTGTVDGKLVKFSPQGEILLEKELTKGAVTSIVEWKDGLAVATTEGKILWLHPKSFVIKDSFDLGSAASAVYGEMEVESDKLVVYSSRNRLYVF